MKKSFMKNYLLFFVLFWGLLSNLSAQNVLECGNSSSVQPTEYINALNAVTQNTSNVASTLTNDYELAINVIILTGGNLSQTEGEIIADMGVAIDYANQFFTDNYSFYLCSYSTMEAPYQGPFTGDWESIFSPTSTARLNAINVYVSTGGIVIDGDSFAGVARYPWNASPNNMIVLSSNQLTSSFLLAHELGHYFGLLHTFNGVIQSPGDDCNTTGDFICETPIDPGTDGGCSFGCIPDPCYIPNPDDASNPWEFNPDRTNLMGYYYCAPLNFVQEQLDVMSNFLFHSPFRQQLFNSQNLNCMDFPYHKGYVVRPRIEDVNPSNESLDPFRAVNVEYTLSGQSNLLCDPSTGASGTFSTETCGLLPATGDITYGARRVDPFNTSYCYRNGVSTYDIVKITKHILNVQVFTSSYQYIAADVNNSGTVSTADIIKIKKLILGINDDFEDVDSWRFIPAIALKDANFKSAFDIDPFTATWTAPDGTSREYFATGGQKSYLDFVDVNTMNSIVTDEDIWSLYAVKSGDVSFSADVTNNADASCINELDDDGVTALFTETKASAEILSGGITTDELLLASVSVGEFENMGLEGYQFSVNFDDDDLELVAIEPGDVAFSSEDFVVDYTGTGATIKTLWSNFKENPVNITKDVKFFTLVFKPKQNLNSMSGLVDFGEGEDMPDLVVVNGMEKLEIASLLVHFEKVNIKDFVIKEAYGNPYAGSGNLHITLEMKEVKDVSILLQDEFGHSVMLDYENLVLGENDIEILSSTISYLQDGKIYYTVFTDDQVQTGALIKM